MREYYMAYDERYKKVHDTGLSWASDVQTQVVWECIQKLGIRQEDRLLEIGCGEGRDSSWLLKNSYNVIASDVSEEAIAFCKKKYPEYSDSFRIIDCLKDKVDVKFDFIFSVAVLHMLVPDEDRKKFYQFIRNHLKDNGRALVLSMGDGVHECSTDVSKAFCMENRTHQDSKTEMTLAATSCRIVNEQNFLTEIEENGLRVVAHGMTAVEPDFPSMLYAGIEIAV